MKQRLPDHVFETLHLHAQGGLRPADLQRGETDGARSGHHDEIPQQIQIQRYHHEN
jgi:hypothetical protein